MMKKAITLLCVFIVALSMCSCKITKPTLAMPTPTEPTPVMCDLHYGVTADNFYIDLVGAFHGNPPEVEAGKDSTPFLVRLTYTGEEGASYALGDAGDKGDKYLRFRLIYKDKYYFEEYEIYSGMSKSCFVHSGDVLEDLPFLHFEPMEEDTELMLWMIVPEEVMHSDESLYFIINVGDQEYWFDVSDDDLDWYKDRL